MRCNKIPPLVLHIEDDDGDAQFVVRALAQGPTRVRISRAADGLEAIDMLQAILNGEMETPDLVLLDLNLPFYSGFQILQWLSEQSTPRTFPVVVFSSCSAQAALELGANDSCDEYIVKPIEATEFQQTVESICSKYLSPACLNQDPDSAAVGVA